LWCCNKDSWGFSKGSRGVILVFLKNFFYYNWNKHKTCIFQSIKLHKKTWRLEAESLNRRSYGSDNNVLFKLIWWLKLVVHQRPLTRCSILALASLSWKLWNLIDVWEKKRHKHVKITWKMSFTSNTSADFRNLEDFSGLWLFVGFNFHTNFALFMFLLGLHIMSFIVYMYVNLMKQISHIKSTKRSKIMSQKWKQWI